eukprot:scaffold68694_cov28-Cyclotella_meneghiniana.AAC.1
MSDQQPYQVELTLPRGVVIADAGESLYWISHGRFLFLAVRDDGYENVYHVLPWHRYPTSNNFLEYQLYHQRLERDPRLRNRQQRPPAPHTNGGTAISRRPIPDLAMIAAANVNQTQPTEAQKQKQKASIAKKPTNTVKATKESTQPPLKPTKPTSPAKPPSKVSNSNIPKKAAKKPTSIASPGSKPPSKVSKPKNPAKAAKKTPTSEASKPKSPTNARKVSKKDKPVPKE